MELGRPAARARRGAEPRVGPVSPALSLAIAPPSQASVTALPLGRGWPAALAALGAYFLWLVAWFWDTVASMVTIWYRSETFAHGFVVIPIAIWLIWRKRHELAHIEPRPAVSTIPLVVMLLANVGWLLGDLADVQAARYLAWVTMLVTGVWLLTGPVVTRRVMFPLAYLYFAIPVGEFLLPTLIAWTADFTEAAMRLSGVPVLREGMILEIPTGRWSIVEACSGLRYLIASTAIGTLYAYLTYRSAFRRVSFVATAIVVPIFANWLRAYMIVMLGHLSGNRLAVGVDHLIYGWIFFGLVMLLLFWVGGFWREDPVQDATYTGSSRVVRATNRWHSRPRWGAALGVALLAAALAPAADRFLFGHDLHRLVDISAPPLRQWRPASGHFADWKPEFLPPRATIESDYAKGADRAGMYVAVYFEQDRDHKLVSSMNQLLRTSDTRGYLIGQEARTLDVGGTPLSVQEALLRYRGGRLLVRTWFWIDGEYTSSPVRAKLIQAQARLRGHGDAGAIIVVYVPVSDDGPVQQSILDDVTQEAAVALRPLLAERLQAVRPQ